MEILKSSGNYSIVKENECFIVYEGAKKVKTPYGKTVKTRYLSLAERILDDLNTWGYDSYDLPISILSYHFTMVDSFATMKKDEIVNMLNCLNWEKNWSFQSCPTGSPEVLMQWMEYFGQGNERIQQIRKWFENQTHMQLTASTCVYNATMSYNVAFIMACIVELLPEEKHKQAIEEFYGFYCCFDREFTAGEFNQMFDCFKLYYGIHFKEEGGHIPVQKQEQ